MLHRHCKINGVPNIKVAIFYMVNIVEHELQFARKILHVCLEIHCDLSTAKVMKLLEGSVQTLILAICKIWFRIVCRLLNISMFMSLLSSGAFSKILYTPYISRGFYFREFRESGASREFNNTQNIYLRSGRMNAACVLLLDREFNHSRKCLEVPIREKLDSRNI